MTNEEIINYFTTVGWYRCTCKKGSTFRVEASGVLIVENPEPRGQKEFTPEGGGDWGWYKLSVRIGKNVIPVGRNRGGIAPEEGDIELGAPRSQTVYPDDAKGVNGTYKT